MSPLSSAWRFALTGGLATLTHVALVVTMIELGGVLPGVANGVAFLAANSLSYAINTRWSFSASYSFSTWRRFFLVSLLAGGASAAIAAVVDSLGGHYLIGLALVVCLVPILSFFAHHWFTYAPSVYEPPLPK